METHYPLLAWLRELRARVNPLVDVPWHGHLLQAPAQLRQ